MINQISIKNFKSIRKLDLALSPINLLIGANGAGKSNFISFFKFLNNLYTQHRTYAPKTCVSLQVFDFQLFKNF
jgi:predicted ATPase